LEEISVKVVFKQDNAMYKKITQQIFRSQVHPLLLIYFIENQNFAIELEQPCSQGLLPLSLTSVSSIGIRLYMNKVSVWVTAKRNEVTKILIKGKKEGWYLVSTT